MAKAANQASGVVLSPALTAAMRDELPSVAREVVAAVIAGVPAYKTALSARMRATIQQAVQFSLAGFVELVAAVMAGGTPPLPIELSEEGS